MIATRRTFFVITAGALISTMRGHNVDYGSVNSFTKSEESTFKTIDEDIDDAIRNKRHTGDLRISKIPDMSIETDEQLVDAIKILLSTAFKDHINSPIELDRDYFASLIAHSIEGFKNATPGDYVKTYKGNWIIGAKAIAAAAYSDDFSENKLLLNPDLIRTLWKYRNYPEIRMALDGFFIKEGVHLKNFSSSEHRKKLEVLDEMQESFIADNQNLGKAKKLMQAHLNAEYTGYDVIAQYTKLREFSPVTVQRVQMIMDPRDSYHLQLAFSPLVAQEVYSSIHPEDHQFTKLIARVGFISSIAKGSNLPGVSDAARLIVREDFDRLGITRDIPGTNVRVDFNNPRLQSLVNDKLGYLLDPLN